MISKALFMVKINFLWPRRAFSDIMIFRVDQGLFLDHDLNFFAKIKLLTPYFYRDKENLKLKAPVNPSFINYVTFFNKNQP